MKKIFLLFFCCLILCGCTKIHAKDAVKEFLESYRNFSSDVEQSVKDSLNELDINEQQKEQYVLLMKKQFVSMKYKIKAEIFNGNEATVFVDVTVLDYHNSIKKAFEEDSGENSFSLVLEKMNKEKKYVTYTVSFKTFYENDEWHIEQPSEETLEKLQGIYAG